MLHAGIDEAINFRGNSNEVLPVEYGELQTRDQRWRQLQ